MDRRQRQIDGDRTVQREVTRRSATHTRSKAGTGMLALAIHDESAKQR